MKKLMLSVVLSAVMLPAISMAESNSGMSVSKTDPQSQMESTLPPPPPQDAKMEMSVEKPMMKDEMMPPPPPRFKNKMGGKGYNQMTLEQKEAFFDDRIKQMEDHVDRMKSEIIQLKEMSVEEKEMWFKNKKRDFKNKHKMKGKKKGHGHKGFHGKKMKGDFRGNCDNLKGLNPPKNPEEAMERMKASKRYQMASPEKKAEIEARIEKFNSLSPEERAAQFEKKREKMQRMCNKMS